MKVYLISLGCAKNSVDSEKLLGVLQAFGVPVVHDIAEADIAIVNTCGFIQSAVEENVNVILDLESMKEKGLLKKIGVVGCLVNRYGDELKKELPTVDLWAKAEEWGNVAAFFGGSMTFEGKRGILQETRPWSRYLKVGEGCDTFCSYCTIPSIRGKARSIPLPELLQEAQSLVQNGAKELCLVGQDLTIYGRDLYGDDGLRTLLRALDAELPEEVWIRMLYLHPSRIDESFIDMVAENPRILSYLDIPIQHIDDEILHRMNRPDKEGHIRRIFAYARSVDPLFALRTTIITGFPGETERQFNKVLNFLEEAEIDRVGAFMYSPEEGTPAAQMEGQVDASVKNSRYDRLMTLQAEISLERQRLFLGRTLSILVDEISQDDGFAWGRSYRDAPEVDGLVGVAEGAGLTEGAFVEVLITDAEEHDLFAEISGN
ncbi:MAG: 30S ribosomal protein S12 methylthiotransferase RimO [Synergistaceae bacterium]|nr:30S ribosomal protein S12 methylthiotransferase RimO [Synergistaceae bacterium]MDD3915516.1 30S ribosomal protein S12 methylthiotransferase RimO [Synergistaceae bacterium]MDD4431862.1 30S ribosomal protein S12 methylthiotransferase RimO [Bacteroidales bacterium]HOO88051.1 30S ribosomal protein S12 methylthiotransferase RimO [Synergistales bacterium]HRV97653.1 30S ribosomal protein S12 methylthiotransferase RimO [Aminobacteriaceae bacterium]